MTRTPVSPADTLNLVDAPPRQTLRSVGAVLAGLVMIFVVSTLLDIVMHASGIFPPWFEPMADGLFLLAFAYRTVINIAGCYLAARLAPNRPMGHALALGAIGLALSLAATIGTWNRPDIGPNWYPLLLTASALPCAWLGGALRGSSL